MDALRDTETVVESYSTAVSWTCGALGTLDRSTFAALIRVF